MFEFALFIVAVSGAFVMVHSVVKQLSQPKMKVQPIKVEKEREMPRRQNKRPY